MIEFKNIKYLYTETPYEYLVTSHEDEDEETFFETNKQQRLIYEINKQSIFLNEIRLDGEGWFENTWDIMNCLVGSPYKYLCDVLNNEDNVTVIVFQVYGTTADYIIIHGHYFTKYDEIKEYFSKYKLNPSMKYVEYINDECQICKV